MPIRLQTIALVAAVCGSAFLGAPLLANAQPEVIRAAREEVLASYQNFRSATGNGILPAKKILLEKIVDLQVVQTRELVSRLETFSDIEPEFAVLRDRLQNNLTGHLAAFETLKESIIPGLTVESVESIGVATASILEGEYRSDTEKAVHFTLLFQSQQSLTTARLRFTKISETLKQLKLSRAKNDAAWRLLSEAAVSLHAASDLQNRAKAVLGWYLKGIGSNQELEAATGRPPVSSAPPRETEKFELPVTTLIEESLNSLKSAYQHFIAIHELVSQ